MRQPVQRSLALRVGQCADDPASLTPAGEPGEVCARPGGSECIAELPYEGAQNPWDLDAVLLLAEPLLRVTKPPAELIDRVAEALRRESPAPNEREALLPELLSAAHVWAREPCVGSRSEFRLSLACVRRGHCWAAQAPGMPVYLLRDGTLQPLERSLHPGATRGEEADLEPEIVSQRLQDGDALLLCSQSLHAALSDREVQEILVRAPSPEVAARKLVGQARVRGAASPAATVLFAGVGPAVAYRLRAPVRASGSPAALTASPRATGTPLALVVGLTGLAGAVLGAGIGVWVSLTLARGEAAPVPATPLDTTHSVIAPVGSGAALMPPTSSAMPRTPTPPPPLAAPAREAFGSDRDASTPPEPIAAQQTAQADSTGASSTVPLPESGTPPTQPAALQGQPPRHTLAPGLGEGVHLTLQIDSGRGALGVRTNQGTLYSSTFPQGVPVGETLTLPLAALQKDLPAGEGAELRFYSGNQVATSLQGDSLQRLIEGQPVGVPGLRAGDYQLAWWNPASATATPPFCTLRVGGL